MCTSCSNLSQSQALMQQPTPKKTSLHVPGENQCAPIQNELHAKKQATGFATELRKILATMARF